MKNFIVRLQCWWRFQINYIKEQMRIAHDKGFAKGYAEGKLDGWVVSNIVFNNYPLDYWKKKEIPNKRILKATSYLLKKVEMTYEQKQRCLQLRYFAAA